MQAQNKDQKNTFQGVSLPAQVDQLDCVKQQTGFSSHIGRVWGAACLP